MESQITIDERYMTNIILIKKIDKKRTRHAISSSQNDIACQVPSICARSLYNCCHNHNITFSPFLRLPCEHVFII